MLFLLSGYKEYDDEYFLRNFFLLHEMSWKSQSDFNLEQVQGFPLESKKGIQKGTPFCTVVSTFLLKKEKRGNVPSSGRGRRFYRIFLEKFFRLR